MNRQPLTLSLRIAAFIGALALAGCGTTDRSIPLADTSGKESARISLSTAYELLNDGKLIEALVDYRRVVDTTRPESAEHRQALAGIVLVHVAPGDNPVYDVDKALNTLDELHQATGLARPLPPSEGLLFTALRRMLEADLRVDTVREELAQSREKNEDLEREKRQLEDALVKLRRLSLE